jgi:ribonuclease III
MPDDRHAEHVRALEERIAHRFEDGALIQEALTHASFANEMGAGMPHNERLEFLGDAVLGLVVGHWLYGEFTDRPEGLLTQMRSRLVNTSTLAALARELGLGEALLIGVGEERTGGRERRSLLADTMEAVLGAVYLDAGYGASERVIRGLLASRVEALDEGPQRDLKSKLQELCQATLKVTPVYTIIATSGPAHDTRFEAEVSVGEHATARGAGHSKQDAEKAAAGQALEQLKSQIADR